VLSYLEPFRIFDPFESEKGVVIVLTLCGFYFVGFFFIIGYIAVQKNQKNPVNDLLSKVAIFVTLIHGKIIFYFIHCFVMKALNSDKEFCSDSVSFSCTAIRILVPIVLLTFNVTITILQELFCYQIHQNQHPYGIKNNLHNQVRFFHKLIVIILLFSFEDPAKILILFNVAFALFDLLILHYRLPFYNTKILQLSIACSTISAACAMVTIARFSITGENLCLIMMLFMPLIVKISLRQLNKTLWEIFSLRMKSPFQAVHLAILVQDYFDKNTIFPLPSKISKPTLYSLGFIGSDVKSICLSIKEGDLVNGSQEIEKAAYFKIIQELTKMLQRHPQNELLFFSIAQIYSQIFKDSFKAFDVINKLNEKNQSFVGRISLKSISEDLTSLHEHNPINEGSDNKERRKNSHLSYFVYRKKIGILKNNIKLEIQDHVKLWKTFSSEEINVFDAITHASKISSHTRNITHYWQRCFEGSELLYINASLIYGLYLEIIQSIPVGGSAFLKKAYGAINNKCHAFRDVLDVVAGNSAVIVASIEHDKVGRIIDTSSSVGELFKTTKQGLIGTNIGVIIPSFIAVKHNDLIRGHHHKYFSGNIDHNINSYAKTLQDDYFKVEITLHVSPMTHTGLNLVAYIRKQSEYQSLMIVDGKGNIVEYSKDLSAPLHLYMKKNSIKIDQLCPDFKKINQAFAILYKNTDYENENEELLQSPKPKGETNFETLMMPLATPTGERLLKRNNDEYYATYRSGNERILSSNNDEPILLTHKTTINEPHLENNNNNMTIEEAQDIWDAVKDSNKRFRFYPLLKGRNSEKVQKMSYEIEIEPYLFDKTWYKIVKLKLYHDENKQRILPLEDPIMNIVDDFADIFPSEGERTEAEVEPVREVEYEDEMFESQRRFESRRKSVKQVTVFSAERKYSSESSFTVNMINNNLNEEINEKKFSNKTHSKISRVTSQVSQKMTAERLTESLKIEKQSTGSKLMATMVYVTIIAIICSLVIHLLYTTDSLNQMQSSISLNQLVNIRLAKTVTSLNAMLILYARSIKMRPIDFRVVQYQAVAINSSMIVLDNAKKLAEEADKFQKPEIIASLYAKTVALYEPFDGTMLDNRPMDQFSATQILISYYLGLAKYKGSYLDLANSREFLFSINSTGNDYLLTLDRSISDLEDFFTRTKNTNVKLLAGITTVEILFVLSPLTLILVILFIVVRTYSKLFQAIGRINESSLVNRVKQLEDLSELFEKNLEDDVSCFHKFKRQGLTVKAFNEKKKTSLTRVYNIKNLTMYLLRYIIVAAILVFILIAFVAVSFQKSKKHLDDLETISNKALTLYDAGSKIRMIVPAYYISMMFKNNTSYKIRNGPPLEELVKVLEIFGGANDIFYKTLKDENGEISDPVFYDILNGDVCKYVSAASNPYCVRATKGNSYGLLGIQAYYYTQVCQPMRDWINTPDQNKTFDLSVSLATLYASLAYSVDLVCAEMYDYITNSLVDSFLKNTEVNKAEMKDMFYQNLAAVLVSMFLIRIIVLTKLQKFDLGIRRILRVIPYRIIEENKVMSCYLARTFQNELKVMQQLT